VDSAERELIVQALARSGNNKSKAARLLGLTRAQLRSRIEKHGLSSED
jgi:transcriptional regulator with GAF, ATPase, and Fis domain